jgi:hypothetical protein
MYEKSIYDFRFCRTESDVYVTQSVSKTIERRMVQRLVNNESKKIQNEASWPN